jgi:hypothetical protein
MSRVLCVLLASATPLLFVGAQPPAPPAADGWGRLHGRVRYDGLPPQLPDLRDLLARHPDKDNLLQGDTRDPTWRVDPATGGVANVVVWLEPPPGRTFPVPPRKTWPDVVTLDTRHGHYEPRVFVLFPAYLDPRTRKWQSTGQVFQVTNTSRHVNNVRFMPNGGDNEAFNVTLPPPEDDKVFRRSFPIKPTPGRAQPLQSAIYRTGLAYLFAFDHPYATVTRPDGSFDLPQVPAGMSFRVRAWHEVVGYLPIPVREGFWAQVPRGAAVQIDLKFRDQ